MCVYECVTETEGERQRERERERKRERERHTHTQTDTHRHVYAPACLYPLLRNQFLFVAGARHGPGPLNHCSAGVPID